VYLDRVYDTWFNILELYGSVVYDTWFEYMILGSINLRYMGQLYLVLTVRHYENPSVSDSVE
jgi:hypothetical protein